MSEIDKEKIVEAAKKMVQDKKLIKEYSKGNITKEELEERGVELAMPLDFSEFRPKSNLKNRYSEVRLVEFLEKFEKIVIKNDVKGGTVGGIVKK